jgi:predicted DNA-binding WGR domain protein
MRRFEFVGGSSAKFWMAEVQGSTFIIVFGRLGTEGQRKEKAFPTEEAAQREYERKVAEKLREGYQEVAAAGTAAPAEGKGTKGAAAASLKLALPPRVRKARAKAEQLSAAVEALKALESTLGERSWRVTRQARRARRALRALGGYDPASHAQLGPLVDSLLAKVVAPKGEPRLALRLAMELLGQLDAAAFTRALEQWKKAPTQAPAAGATAVLAREAEALGEPELALRLGVLLADKPHLRGSSEPGWQRRWSELRPHLEGHLKGAGTSLKAFVRSLEAKADAHMAARAARLTD